jgi:hypothetical protein
MAELVTDATQTWMCLRGTEDCEEVVVLCDICFGEGKMARSYMRFCASKPTGSTLRQWNSLTGLLLCVTQEKKHIVGMSCHSRIRRHLLLLVLLNLQSQLS